MEERRGFFVKVENSRISESYIGPFDSLKNTRDESKRLGSNLGIYHGTIKYDDKTYNTDELSFIEKCLK